MGGWVKQPPAGTRAVLNLTEEEDPYRCETHLWEPIPDNEPAPSIDWLRRMVEYIDTARREGKPTFVHCFNGVSRSGMVITAYEMFKNGWTREGALAFVRTKRPQVRPNSAFMQRLAEWERVLKEKKAPSP
jgi:protein-tyrosine phosphatase